MKNHPMTAWYSPVDRDWLAYLGQPGVADVLRDADGQPRHFLTAQDAYDALAAHVVAKADGFWKATGEAFAADFDREEVTP